MADMPDEPEMQDNATEEAAEPSTAGGYCVELHVYPDGSFGVSGPEPLDTEEEQGEEERGAGDKFSSLTDALKALLSVVKENPVGESEQSQFDAGYTSE